MTEAPIYNFLKDIILIFILGVSIGAISAVATKPPEIIEIKKPELIRT